jgi:hypothetical protein
MGIFDWGKKKQPAYKPPKASLSGNFTVGLGAIEIRYTNFVGEQKTFTGDYRSAYIRGRHIVIRLVPTGKRISLNLEKIENRSEVEPLVAANPRPSANERRILHYHLKRGSTSALFEQIRSKYPHYEP